MRLRTKLLAVILSTLLLQLVVTGGFSMMTFIRRTQSATDTALERDWQRARAHIEELKHRLMTDLYEIRFLMQDGRLGRPESLRQSLSYFISLTDADQVMIVDQEGSMLVDERARPSAADGLAAWLIDPRHFRFPRNEFVAATAQNGDLRLYLVTGTTLTAPDGTRSMLYLVTNIDKAMADATWAATGATSAVFLGDLPIASSTAAFSLDGSGPEPYRTVVIGNDPYRTYRRAVSYDLPDVVYLVSLGSSMAERLLIRPVLLSYLLAFLFALAASIFLAAGITTRVISPFSRLNQWLHAYLKTGSTGELAVHTNDEIGFLAGAFHSMTSTLIAEKTVIEDQLDQIRLLHVHNESIMNNIKAAIIVTDAAGSIEFCNGYFLELTRATFSRLKGEPFTSVLSRYFVLAGRSRTIAELPRDHDVVVDGLRRDGSGGESMRFTAKICPLRLSGSRRGGLIVLEDTTAAERLWEKMTIAAKVTGLSLLSAGMAHEINNPLGSILSHVGYLKAVEKELEKLDSLTWIESETRRIAAIVSRMRAYSTPRSGPDDGADLNALVRETLEVLRFTLEEHKLQLHLQLAPTLPTVACGSDELKQVILNITLNAIQACSIGGTITFRTARGTGGGARLTVRDNGVGIAPEHLANVFDPFYTTKPAGEGDGLGLSICYAIIKQAGGEIQIDSAPSRGTEVEVKLRCT